MRSILLALGLFAAVLTHGAAAAERDAVPRIAVMSAFEPEWEALLAQVEAPEQHLVAGTRFVTGKLEGRDVVLFLSGVSMVNAAMTTQQAIDYFAIRAIVFSGIAGGVDPALGIGDVVVAERWASYLESAFAREAPDGSFAVPPFITRAVDPGSPDKAPYPGFGMILPTMTDIARAGSDTPERVFWMPADGKLLDLARQAAAGVALDRCAPNGACLAHEPKVVVGGNGVSGSAFVDNAKFRAYVFDTYRARVLDMESAATAQVARSNEVPFIAFRSLSDLAGGGEGGNEMGIFFALAAGNSAKVVAAFVKAMP